MKTGEMPANSKINKSGQNLNNLNAKGTVKQGIQTQRATGNVNSQIVGSTTVRSTKAQRMLSGSSNNNQSKASTIMNSYKMMSNVTEKIIKDHNDRQQDKENKQRLSNKQGEQNLKRNKTSEAVQRTGNSNNTSSTNIVSQSMVSQQSQKQSS